jgi:proline iminopeptidase
MPPIPPPRDSGVVEVQDAAIYWCSYGQPGSPRLLVVHGGPGAQHDYLLPQMLELAKHHELIFYDQRGGGRSKTDDRSPITWRTHVDDLARIVEALALPRPAIVGYSWGALLAMLYAIDAAHHRVAHAPGTLVLLDPAPVTRAFRREFEQEFARRQADPALERLRAELAASGLRERDADAYRHRMFELGVAGYFAHPEAARELTAFRVTGRVQQSVWESLGDFDLLAPGQLDAVHVPSLVVHGRQDPIPLESSSAAAHALGAQFVVLENCGHVPYVEQPEALFATVEAFLSR